MYENGCFLSFFEKFKKHTFLYLFTIKIQKYEDSFTPFKCFALQSTLYKKAQAFKYSLFLVGFTKDLEIKPALHADLRKISTVH
jgi:hypothetical protein